MQTILSTKKFTPSQKELLLNAGLSFVEYDAISITYNSFSLPRKLENLIFTSKNAIKALLKKDTAKKFSDKPCFCVGNKTAAYLLGHGFNVVKKAKNALELAQFITQNFNTENFTFFCGNLRRDELPNTLRQKKVSLEEIVVYNTQENPKKFKQQFDAVLFFSPSGIKSFTKHNSLNEQLAVCIGETTAAEASKYTNKITVANSTSVESVIAHTFKTLNP